MTATIPPVARIEDARVAALVQEAQPLYLNGEHRRAGELLDQALALAPDHPQVLAYRGLTKLHAQDWAGALEDFTRSLARFPDNPNVLESRGKALVALGRPAEAQADLLQVRAMGMPPERRADLENGVLAGLNLQASELVLEGKFEQALALYDLALEVDPDDATILANRGSNYVNLRRWPEAIADLDRSLAHEEDPSALYARATVRMVQGQRAAALGDYTRCVELAPGNPQALRGRGLCYAEMGEHALALADFEDALAVQPDDAQALYGRGASLAALGEHTRALEDLDRALALGLPTAHAERARRQRAASLDALGR